MCMTFAARVRRWGASVVRTLVGGTRTKAMSVLLAGSICGVSGAGLGGPLDPFPYNADSTLVIPYVTQGGIGSNGETFNGTVSLQAGFQDRHGSPLPTGDIRYAFTVNGAAVSPILQAGDTYQWDTTQYNDGGHALGLVIVDGADDMRNYRAYSLGAYVSNQPGSTTGPISTPSFGSSHGSRLYGVTPDWVTIDPSTDLPGAAAAPLTPVYTAPVHAQPGRFGDPLDAHSAQRFIEALTQGNTGLYQGDPGLYLTRDGNPIILRCYPQVTDDAAESLDQVLRQNTKPGACNNNLVSPYATYTPDPDGPGYIEVDLAG